MSDPLKHLAPDGHADAAGFDEIASADGVARPHWTAFADTVGRLGTGALAGRRADLQARVRRLGATYTIHADPKGVERPWPLDLLPVIVPDGDWRVLEAGLVQRAWLLNAMLDDLYGAQTLVEGGVVPAALLHADPGFLRPCHGIRPPHGVWLHLYAADVVRRTDGGWCVLSDRAQAPSGAGYALVNRAAAGQVLGEAASRLQVRPITPFLSSLRSALRRLAPEASAGGEPRIVLLTPGVANETYFEQVHLARHLGIRVVAGGDLTVRGRQVFLKTISGLDRVDVILRRLDDSFADPVELRADSSLGTPGLLQAVRAGTVAVVNALGSGLAQSPAFLPFLPAVCRRLFGEDPVLPSVATAWCGSPGVPGSIAARIGELVVKPAFSSRSGALVAGGDLEAGDKAALLARIAAHPSDFVVQQRLAPSVMPVLDDGEPGQQRPVVLRIFLVWTAEGYRVMPGGLARAAAPGGLDVSMQTGGFSKDIWILSGHGPPRAPAPGGAAHGQPPAEEIRIALRTSGDGLASRVADSLFWMGRYVERIEGSVKILDALRERAPEATALSADGAAAALVDLAVWLGLLPLDAADRPNLADALEEAVFGMGLANSIGANVERLHRAAAGVRDRIPADMWRALGFLEEWSGRRASGHLPPFDEMRAALAAFAGYQHEAMARDLGWLFLDLGRRLERSLFLVSVLKGAGAVNRKPGGDPWVLDALLEVADAVLIYRERYTTPPRRQPTLHLLVADAGNPRSLAFQLARMDEHLDRLPGLPAEPGTGADPMAGARRILAEARSAVADPAVLEDDACLRRLVDTLNDRLPAITELLAHGYFIHASIRRA